MALLDLDEATFHQQFGHTPLKRTGRRGLVRNVCVALGNSGDLSVVPALVRALGDTEPLVRGHAAWALGRLGGETAIAALIAQREMESDAWVGEEIALALD